MSAPVVDRWLKKQYATEAERQAVAKAFQDLFGSRSAAAVLEDLRRFCNVYDTSFVPGDPYMTHVNEGRRQAYLHIVQLIEVTAAEIEQPKRSARHDRRDDERPADDG